MNVKLGYIDYDKFKSGNYIIVSTNDENKKTSLYKPGDKVVLNNSNNIAKEYEVLAIADIPYVLSARYVQSFNLSFFISEEEFNAQYGNILPMIVTLDVEKDKQKYIESYLKNYTENRNNISYESRNLFEKEFNSTKRTYETIGLVLSFILALIGIMNFTNTIITSVILRKHELAMLQSIGMTRVQTKKMLMWEGIIYSIMTSVFVLTIGIVINYFIGKCIISSIWFLKFKFTIIPVIICLPILFFIAITVPSICYKYLSKLSIIERLREID
ncbi:FtsX-like permease family protein [Clostridium tepidiprofundi DSM 19306]|uniref:FtsX-like permease family protein n=1 Tax=Clostridium tepidiprofundi DSM 19306 TaxID=1121338 RepID=A0A151AWX8_9CLOT|nr:FtsX-like permease family protein [Clostridium tepidiprofundi]KYH32053.1 FtsX-like permease family protein [Clostridium tepidiprofundi DSM 19306]